MEYGVHIGRDKISASHDPLHVQTISNLNQHDRATFDVFVLSHEFPRTLVMILTPTPESLNWIVTR